jgi:ribose transport system permease protein
MTTQDSAPPRMLSSFALRAADPYLVLLAQRLAAVCVLVTALSLVTEGFATIENILNVLRQTSLLFLIGSGLTLVVLGGGLDLSIAANLTLSACLAAGAIKATGSSAAGLAVAVACGTSIGLANGLLVTRLRIPPFLASYGMLWVVQGLAYTYMGGQVIYGFPAELRFLGTGFLLGIPVPVWIMMVSVVLASVAMSQTAFGREVLFMGGNETAARLSGIPVDRRRLVLYTLSGTAAGLASIVYLGRVNAAEAGIGEPLLLPAVASVLIGGTSLFGGSGGLVGTALGALILTLVVNGLNLLDVSAAWHPFVTGLIVLLAVGLDRLGARRAA